MKLWYPWNQNITYEVGTYAEYPQGFVYICIETATAGQSPVSKPLKWKLAFGSSFPGTVSSITAALPIAVTPDPITTTGTVTSSMATNKLIGRYAAGTGVMQEVTIGSGLTLSGGGVLSASIGSIGWLLDGNTVGSEKFIGTLDNFAFPVRVNNTEVWSWETSGVIQRFGTMWSKPTSVGQGLTTWGESAGFSCSTSSESTMIGFNAGVTLASGNGLTAVGSYALYVASVSSNTGVGSYAGRNHTSGHSCTYLGFSAGYPAAAGDNLTGNYSTAIGTYSLIGGSFNNVLSICGVGTQANQIVLGGATNLNNAATCHYESMRVVFSSDLSKIHDTYYRTSTPESAQSASRGSVSFVDDATDGEGYIKSSGTGNTGWAQIIAATAATNETITPDYTLTVKYQGATYKIPALLIP